MFGLFLRGFFLLGIISWYSTSVWKFIDDYFRNEYKSYLSKEFKRNKHLQLRIEVPLEVPETAAAPEFSPEINEINNHREEISESDLQCEQLDYHNFQRTNDQQMRDDDGFVSYWQKREGKDNSESNLHCKVEEATCEDN